LTHVRNIEDPNVVSHGLMFPDDACVLDRHEPAAERNNFRAALDMFFVQWRGFLLGFAHAGKLGVDKKERKLPACNLFYFASKTLALLLPKSWLG